MTEQADTPDLQQDAPSRLRRARARSLGLGALIAGLTYGVPWGAICFPVPCALMLVIWVGCEIHGRTRPQLSPFFSLGVVALMVVLWVSGRGLWEVDPLGIEEPVARPERWIALVVIAGATMLVEVIAAGYAKQDILRSVDQGS